MKVIKRGKWIEECKFCKSLIEIIANELKYIGQWKKYSDADNKIGFECPVCKNDNVLRKTRVTESIKRIVAKKYDWDHY